MKKRYLVLLVLASIFLTFSLFLFLSIVLPFDMKAYKESLNQSTAETDSATEAVVGGVAVGLAGAFAFIFILILTFLSAIGSVVTIPLSLSMLKSETKTFKIFGIVYASVAGLVIIAEVVKFISWMMA